MLNWNEWHPGNELSLLFEYILGRTKLHTRRNKYKYSDCIFAHYNNTFFFNDSLIDFKINLRK